MLVLQGENQGKLGRQMIFLVAASLPATQRRDYNISEAMVSDWSSEATLAGRFFRSRSAQR
jgi:hypothetical protein